MCHLHPAKTIKVPIVLLLVDRNNIVPGVQEDNRCYDAEKNQRRFSKKMRSHFLTLFKTLSISLLFFAYVNVTPIKVS